MPHTIVKRLRVTECLGVLQAFSSHSEWSDYCLAHLFTYLAFSDGVLGLGWIASSASNQAGGICSPCKHNSTTLCFSDQVWVGRGSSFHRRTNKYLALASRSLVPAVILSKCSVQILHVQLQKCHVFHSCWRQVLQHCVDQPIQQVRQSSAHPGV